METQKFNCSNENRNEKLKKYLGEYITLREQKHTEAASMCICIERERVCTTTYHVY